MQCSALNSTYLKSLLVKELTLFRHLSRNLKNSNYFNSDFFFWRNESSKWIGFVQTLHVQLVFVIFELIDFIASATDCSFDQRTNHKYLKYYMYNTHIFCFFNELNTYETVYCGQFVFSFFGMFDRMTGTQDAQTFRL